MQKILITGGFVFKTPVIKNSLMVPVIIGTKEQKIFVKVSVHDPPFIPPEKSYINICGEITKISIQNDNVVIDVKGGEIERGLKTEIPQVLIWIPSLKISSDIINDEILKVSSKLFILLKDKKFSSLNLKKGDLISIYGDFWVSISGTSCVATIIPKGITLLQKPSFILEEIREEVGDVFF